MDINRLFQEAEFSLAAYSDLPEGTPIPANLSQEGKGLSSTQADEFASRYTVITQYHDETDSDGFGTSFSATVFKDTTGNQTLAIRGALELIGSPNDLSTDADILTEGAGYD